MKRESPEYSRDTYTSGSDYQKAESHTCTPRRSIKVSQGHGDGNQGQGKHKECCSHKPAMGTPCILAHKAVSRIIFGLKKVKGSADYHIVRRASEYDPLCGRRDIGGRESMAPASAKQPAY